MWILWPPELTYRKKLMFYRFRSISILICLYIHGCFSIVEVCIQEFRICVHWVWTWSFESKLCWYALNNTWKISIITLAMPWKTRTDILRLYNVHMPSCWLSDSIQNLLMNWSKISSIASRRLLWCDSTIADIFGSVLQ